MSFANTQYLTIALVVIAIIALLLNRLNSSFFKWVKTYWFYERTWISRFSSLFYLLSLFLLMVSLLDLRGPEKKVKASLPDQRTIIMIDTSSSMLAEDVRPSRFVKALQMARHFVKNAAGHQISVVLFSDIQKRLIPFTDDIDLIDSRLAALENTNSVAGGSNISQAIEEAIQYFEFDSSDDDKSKSGNMLVFTDAEESEGEFKVNVPKNVNLAIVGLGTLKGANIPLRWEDGGFRGYKTFKGQPVVTKLDEEYIKKIGKRVSSFRYWIANSYSLPTEDIMNFFRSTYAKSQNKGDLRVRPVYSHYILIPAIIFYCVSVLLGRFPVFKTAKNLVLIFGLIFGMQNARAEEKEKPMSPEIKKDLELVKEGKADRKYVLKVAEKMLKDKDDKQATELYSEYSKKNDDEEIKFNYATSLLKTNRLAEALPLVQELMKTSKNEDLKNKLRNNLLISTDPNKQKEQEKKNQDKKDQQNQNQQDQKDKKDNKDSKDNQNNKDQQNQKQQDNKKDGGKNDKDDKNNKPEGKQDNSQKKPDNNGKPDDKKEDKKEDKKKDNKNGKEKDENEEDKENQKPQGPQTLEEKEKEIEQKRRMTKTPAMIKQILSDDRELQKKMMDTSTNERGEMKPKRDW